MVSHSVLSPHGTRTLHKKLCFFFGFLFNQGSDRHPGLCPHPSLIFNPSVAFVLSGHSPHSFTQLFIILISILPFPSSLYLSLSPKLTQQTTHPLPEAFTDREHGKRGVFSEKSMNFRCSLGGTFYQCS